MIFNYADLALVSWCEVNSCCEIQFLDSDFRSFSTVDMQFKDGIIKYGCTSKKMRLKPGILNFKFYREAFFVVRRED
jgi:hypothetical protein